MWCRCVFAYECFSNSVCGIGEQFYVRSGLLVHFEMFVVAVLQ